MVDEERVSSLLQLLSLSSWFLLLRGSLFFFSIGFIVLKENYPMLHIDCNQRQRGEVYLG